MRVHELSREIFLRFLEQAGITEEEYFAGLPELDAISQEPTIEVEGKFADTESFGWSPTESKVITVADMTGELADKKRGDDAA